MATLGYKPTEIMMRIKALYWMKVKEIPGDIPCTLTQAVNITEDSRLHEWWRDPEFVKWFTEEDTWKIEMEVLCMQLPYYIKQVLAEESVKGLSAKVRVIQLLAEITNKMPSKVKEVKFADEQVGKMDKPQLEEFIKKYTKQLKAVK